VPKLWLDTIEGHRREVRRAILETTAALAAEHGVARVTMSQVAQATGIGRATLYKYFSNVEAILDAWHEDQVDQHLERLAEVRDREARPDERLRAVLGSYAEIVRERSRAHDATHRPPRQGTSHAHAERGRYRPAHQHGRHSREVALLVHRSDHVQRAQRRLTAFLGDVLKDTVRSGDVRGDVAPDELASYCVHALAGARALRTKAQVARLVALTLSGLTASQRACRAWRGDEGMR